MTIDAFLDEHFGALSRYAAVLTGNRDLAHDVLADSLAYAIKHWTRIGGTENPYGYVRKVVTTTYLQHLRRERHRPRSTALHTANLRDRPVEAQGTVIEARDELEQAIQKLSATQMAVIAMTFYLDMTPREIGQQLSKSEAAVRAHLSKALARLRRSWPQGDDMPTTPTGVLRHDT